MKTMKLSEAVRLKNAMRAQYEASVRNGEALREAKKTLDERIAALAIAVRLMRLHLELVTPNGVGRDSAAWAVAQDRVRVLDELLAEFEGVKAAAGPAAVN